MRLLLAHNRYTQRGGEDTVFEAEAALLREHGHEVFTWEEHNDHLVAQSRLKTATNAVWSVTSRRTMDDLLKRYRPELVHFHNTFLRISPAVYYSCQKAKVPVVQTLHNYRLICPAATLFRDGETCEDCLGRWGFWPGVQHRCWHNSRTQTAVVATMLATHRWLRTWQKQVDLYIALTEFARQKFISGGLPAEKIVVKPNFLNSVPTLAEPLSRSPFALYVGRLAAEKGLQLLVEAWKTLPNISLKIVGDGPLRAQLEEQVRQLGLHQIEFCGLRSQEDVFRFMQEARLIIVPSNWYEGLPLTIIEAFSRMLPVIATQLGSMSEIVRHQETGLHFKPHDAADLAHWVQWGWDHPAQMREMAANAYAEFLQKYSPENNYQLLIEIYRRAIARGA